MGPNICQAKSGVFQGGGGVRIHTHIHTNTRHGDQISCSARETERLIKRQPVNKNLTDDHYSKGCLIRLIRYADTEGKSRVATL